MRFLIYFIMMLDDIKFGVIFVSIILGLALTLWFFSASLDDKINLIKNKLKKASIICGVLFVFGTIIPSTKTAAIIWVAPYIIENKEITHIPVKIIKITNFWMNEMFSSNTEGDK